MRFHNVSVSFEGVTKLAAEKRALIMLFGATGDLANRKLYPAIFNLYKKGSLRKHFALIGTGRHKWNDAKLREVVTDDLKSANNDPEQVKKFVSHFYYQIHDVTNPKHYVVLKNLADKLDQKYQLQGNRLYYISLAPRFFGTVSKNLREQHVLSDNGFNRLMIEKPFGHDYPSAKQLNDSLTATFKKDQVFRIDHYLGKELVQNIAALRFANPLFENIWNHNYIDNVQITLAEKLGVEKRAGYYDGSGALRDMVQNHIMQVLGVIAMEPPKEYNDAEIHAAKAKALNSVQIYDDAGVAKNFIRGQYGAGANGQHQYRDEDGVPSNSNTETYVAGKINVQTPRWSGVPFYVRTGKMLKAKETRVDIVFKPAKNIFGSDNQIQPDVLTIHIEPESGFKFTFNRKQIGHGFKITPAVLSDMESKAEIDKTPQPYERLINDALAGDLSNFAGWSEIGHDWKFVDPIEKHWHANQPDFPNYTPGTMGPKAADELLKRSGRHWIYPER